MANRGLLEDDPNDWKSSVQGPAGTIQLEPISIGEGILMRFLQFKAMTYKSLIMIFKREWISTLLRLLVPGLLILIVFLGIILAPAFTSGLPLAVTSLLHPTRADINSAASSDELAGEHTQVPGADASPSSLMALCLTIADR